MTHREQGAFLCQISVMLHRSYTGPLWSFILYYINLVKKCGQNGLTAGAESWTFGRYCWEFGQNTVVITVMTTVPSKHNVKRQEGLQQILSHHLHDVLISPQNLRVYP